MVLRGDEAWELVPPRFERGSREGCGDSMMGGLAACMAAGHGVGGDAAHRRGGRRRQLPPPRPRQRLAHRDRGPGAAGRAATSLTRPAEGATFCGPTRTTKRCARSRRTARRGDSSSRPSTIARGAMSRIHSTCGATDSISARRSKASLICTRPAAVRGVGVAAEHVDQARFGQGAHAGGGVLAQEEVGGRLDQGAGGDQPRDPLVHVGGEVALGVGDERAVAALGEVVDAAQQGVGQRARRRLEQDPAPASRAPLAPAPPRSAPRPRSRPPRPPAAP